MTYHLLVNDEHGMDMWYWVDCHYYRVDAMTGGSIEIDDTIWKFIEIWCPYHLALFKYILRRVGLFPDLLKCIVRKSDLHSLPHVKVDLRITKSYEIWWSNVPLWISIPHLVMLIQYRVGIWKWQPDSIPTMHRLIWLLLSCKCEYLLQFIAISQCYCWYNVYWMDTRTHPNWMKPCRVVTWMAQPVWPASH